MIEVDKNKNNDKEINYNKKYRSISKIIIILEIIIFLLFNMIIRCACGIPFFYSIPPVIILIIEIILYFITRNRVGIKKVQKWMFVVYIIQLIIFYISLVAIRNPHNTIIS